MHSKYGLGLYIKPDCAAVSLLFQLIRHRINPGPTNLDPLCSMMKTCRWRTLQRFPRGYKQSHDTVHDKSNLGDDSDVDQRWKSKKNSIYKNTRTKTWHNEPLLISSAWPEGSNKSVSSGKTAMMGKFWNSFPVSDFFFWPNFKTKDFLLREENAGFHPLSHISPEGNTWQLRGKTALAHEYGKNAVKSSCWKL